MSGRRVPYYENHPSPDSAKLLLVGVAKPERPVPAARSRKWSSETGGRWQQFSCAEVTSWTSQTCAAAGDSYEMKKTRHRPEAFDTRDRRILRTAR